MLTTLVVAINVQVRCLDTNLLADLAQVGRMIRRARRRCCSGSSRRGR